MKTLLFVLFVCCASFAETIRVLNVFYDGIRGEFAVNTVRENTVSGFLNTKRIVLISEAVANCENGCTASIRGESTVRFAVYVNRNKVASVKVKDSENLLSSKAFGVISTFFGQGQLTMNLDKLKLSGRAEVLEFTNPQSR